MQDPVRAQNLAAVAPLIAGSPVKVGVEASEVLAAVEVELATQGQGCCGCGWSRAWPGSRRLRGRGASPSRMWGTGAVLSRGRSRR
ncbi:MAG: hypothetical protein R3F14_09045 [Polyangiaceae bacterium]